MYHNPRMSSTGKGAKLRLPRGRTWIRPLDPISGSSGVILKVDPLQRFSAFPVLHQPSQSQRERIRLHSTSRLVHTISSGSEHHQKPLTLLMSYMLKISPELSSPGDETIKTQFRDLIRAIWTFGSWGQFRGSNPPLTAKTLPQPGDLQNASLDKPTTSALIIAQGGFRKPRIGASWGG